MRYYSMGYQYLDTMRYYERLSYKYKNLWKPLQIHIYELKNFGNTKTANLATWRAPDRQIGGFWVELTKVGLPRTSAKATFPI